MSGTRAHQIRITEAKYAQLALAENHSAAQMLLINLLLEICGWSEIENWAVMAFDEIRAGRIIDIDALEASISTWKSTNNQD